MIPRKIHYFWIGGNPKPESVLKCIESWKKYCPNYEIIEWNESNYDFTKNLYMRQAYERKKWGFAPDYGRLDVIYLYGGLYFDTDVELIRSPEELLKNRAFFGFDRATDTSQNTVACGLGFGAEQQHPILKNMMDVYSNVSFVKEDGSLNLLPSPYYTTRCLQEYGLKNENRDQLLQDVMIYASDVLCPKSYGATELHLTERTVSIHHFDATWLDEDLKRKHDRTIRINSLLGDKLGFRVDKAINDIEYLQSTLIKRLRNR